MENVPFNTYVLLSYIQKYTFIFLTGLPRRFINKPIDRAAVDCVIFCVLPTLVALRTAFHTRTHTCAHTCTLTFWRSGLSSALECDLDWNGLRRMGEGLLGKEEVTTEAFYLSANVCLHLVIRQAQPCFFLTNLQIYNPHPHPRLPQ